MNRRSEPARPGGIVARLYDMRRVAKSRLGSRYGEEMRRLREVIELIQREDGGSPLLAAAKICAALESITPLVDTVLITAAALEMIEPSEEPVSHA